MWQPVLAKRLKERLTLNEDESRDEPDPSAHDCALRLCQNHSVENGEPNEWHPSDPVAAAEAAAASDMAPHGRDARRWKMEEMEEM